MAIIQILYLMDLNQQQRRLLYSLRKTLPIELDPFDFQSSLALHEAGLAELFVDEHKNRTFLSITAAGLAFLEVARD